MNNKELITLAEAIKLIEEEEYSNPKIDIAHMVRVRHYIRPQGTFRIPFIRKPTEEEATKMRESGRRVTYVENGHRIVNFAAERNPSRAAHEFEYALLDKYRELTGRSIDAESNSREIRSVTTAYDDDNAGVATKLRDGKAYGKTGDFLSGTAETKQIN